MEDEVIQDEQPQDVAEVHPEVNEQPVEVEPADELDPLPTEASEENDVPAPSVPIDSIHSAAAAIEGIWARLYQLEQDNVIHEEGNDAQA